jgi:hypothetical protein
MDAKSHVWTALNGLLPQISAYVIERSPQTLDDVIKFARIAEMTRCSSTARSDDAVIDQLEKLSQQMLQLTTKVSTMTTAAVNDAQFATQATRHVSFAEQRSRSISPQRQNKIPPHSPQNDRHFTRPQAAVTSQNRQSWDSIGRDSQFQPKFQPRNSRQANGFHPSTRQTFVQHQSQLPQSCNRCGPNAHSNPLYCPMINKPCFSCQKLGHAASMFRMKVQNYSKQF